MLSEVKRLTDQYLQKLEVEGGVLWTCTQCGKQGKMKHHVRWVQQHSLAWCVTVIIDILILGNT